MTTWQSLLRFEVLKVELSFSLFLIPSLHPPPRPGQALQIWWWCISWKRGYWRRVQKSRRRTEDNIWNATIVAAIHRDSVGATHRGSAGFYSECACCSTTTTTSPPVRSGPAAAPIEEPLWSDFLCVASATGVDRTGLVSALRFDWCGKNWLDSSSSRNR